MTPRPTAEDLRATIARLQLKRYVVAGDVGLNPARLGLALNGKIPMSDDLAQRVQRVLNQREELRSQQEISPALSPSN